MSEHRLKIALVSPKGPLYRHRGGIWKKSLRYQPLTLTTLAAYVPPELDAEVQLIDEGIADVPLELEAAPVKMRPRCFAMCGFSSLMMGLPFIISPTRKNVNRRPS